ncbi:hypothetical protein GLOIN_2v1550842, partial [Rhizophagus irregularis DAOM 181602=DAOM 197198]
MSIEKQLSQIINSQKNLEKIIFSHDINKYTSRVSGNSIRLYNIIGDSNSSKPLKIIIFYRIDFRNILHIKKAFEQLYVLESIHILECLIFNSNFIQQIIDLDKPLKLISLFIMNENDQRSLFMSDEDRNLQIESMQLLFQKSGEYLENIGIDSYVNDVLKCRALEFINNYCERIKFFDIHMSNIQKVHIVLDSVKIFGQNLNYFSIGVFIHHEKNESIIEMLLKLAQVLPCKLEYLELYFTGTPIVKNVWE